jgi:uncharacterized protein (DUF58 family)
MNPKEQKGFLTRKLNSVPILHKLLKKSFFPVIKWSRFLFLIGLSFGLFAYAKLQGGFLSWFLFYTLLPFLLYAFVLFVYPMSDFYIERVVTSSNLNAGQAATLHIKIRRKQNFPLFFIGVVEWLPEKILHYNKSTIGKVACLPLLLREFSVSYEIPNMPRGEHQFSKIQLKIRDPLSLIEKRKVFLIKDTLVVYPILKKTYFQEFQSDYELGKHVNVIRRNRESSVVSNVREYQPGDRLSTIDWKSTAKRAELMSKDFEDKNSQDLLVAVNSFANREVFEEMVTHAASLIDAEIRTNGKAGLLLISKTSYLIPSRNSKEQRNKCMLALAKIEADSRELCEQFFTLNKGTLSGHCSFVFITDQLSVDIVKRLSSILDKNLSIHVVYFTNSEELSPLGRKAVDLAKGRGIYVQFVQ